MQIVQNSKLASLYLRLAIGSAYLWEVADRLGILGPHGLPHVGWGDWAHFVAYAQQVMGFMPVSIVPALAVLASIGEGVFGLLLIAGLFTRFAAIGSGILSFCFAIAMSISFGIDSPLGYSVFTVSAASLLLATIPQYEWSLDSFFDRKKVNTRLLRGSVTVALLLVVGTAANAQPGHGHSAPAAGGITEKYLLRQLLNESGINQKMLKWR